MTSYKEWFEKYGRGKVDNHPYSYWSEVTIEDLYQNFKSRMEGEILSGVLNQRHVDDLCKHEWVSGDNEVVSGAAVCLKCKTIAPASGTLIDPPQYNKEGDE